MIVSSGNPKVKDMRAARRCKDDRALLEGPHLVAEAVASGLELEIVVATDAFLESAEAPSLLASLSRAPLSIAPTVLDELLDSDSPRGVAAVARLPLQDLGDLPTTAGALVYADRIQDPGNLGAIARSAEGAGAAAILLGPGCAHPNHPRALRASAGSLLRLPRVHAAASELPSAHWLGLDGAAERSIYDVGLPDGVAIGLAVGNEGRGLSPDLREHLDEIAAIPVAEPLESLNAAVAAGIALFEIRRRSSRRS